MRPGKESRIRHSDFDCRTVWHRRFTSSFRLVSPERKSLTRSCTLALVPRHRFPVACCLLPCPAPYRLTGVEVRAVSRQVHQLQVQARRPQALPQYLAPVRSASSTRAVCSGTKASRLASSALANRFLGRLKANPNRCRQFKQLLRHKLRPKCSRTNQRAALRFQLARPMPAPAGKSCNAAPLPGRGEPPDCSKIKALGTPSQKAAAHRPIMV